MWKPPATDEEVKDTAKPWTPPATDTPVEETEVKKKEQTGIPFLSKEHITSGSFLQQLVSGEQKEPSVKLPSVSSTSDLENGSSGSTTTKLPGLGKPQAINADEQLTDIERAKEEQVNFEKDQRQQRIENVKYDYAKKNFDTVAKVYDTTTNNIRSLQKTIEDLPGGDQSPYYPEFKRQLDSEIAKQQPAAEKYNQFSKIANGYLKDLQATTEKVQAVKEKNSNYLEGSGKSLSEATANTLDAFQGASNFIGKVLYGQDKPNPENGGFGKLAFHIRNGTANWNDMPKDVVGDVFAGVSSSIPLIVQTLAAPESDFTLPAILSFNSFGKKYFDDPDALKALKEIPAAAAEGFVLHGLGVAGKNLGELAGEHAKAALNFIPGETESILPQVIDKTTAATVASLGFGGMDALQQYATTGKIDWKQVASNAGTGLAFSIPELAKATHAKAVGDFMQSVPETVKNAIDTDKSVQEIREQSIDLMKKVPELEGVEKEQAIIASQALNKVANIKSVAMNVIEDPISTITDITNSNLPDDQKQTQIDKVKNIVAQNDPRIQESQPLVDEVKKLKAEIDFNNSLPIPEETKTEKNRDVEEKIKGINTQIGEVFKKPVELPNGKNTAKLEAEQIEGANKTNQNEKSEIGKREPLQNSGESSSEIGSKESGSSSSGGRNQEIWSEENGGNGKSGEKEKITALKGIPDDEFVNKFINSGFLNSVGEVGESRVNFGLPTAEVKKAIADLNKGKETAATKHLKERILDIKESGNVPMLQGTGGTTISHNMSLADFHDMINDADAAISDRSKKAEDQIPHDLATLINEEGITLENIDKISESPLSALYSPEEFKIIKDHLEHEKRNSETGQSESGSHTRKETEKSQSTERTSQASENIGSSREPVLKTETKLSPKEKEVETKFRKDLEDNYEKYKKKYITKFGTVFNTDNARIYSKDYRKDPGAMSSATQLPARDFVTRMYNEELNKPAPEGKENLVTFTAGGSGAGKTRFIENAKFKSQMTIDTNFANFDRAKKDVVEALAHGKHVSIDYIFRHPINSFLEGVLPRYLREGRSVPYKIATSIHDKAFQTIQKLADYYKGDDKVDVHFFDNSGEYGKAKEILQEDLKKLTFVKSEANTAIRTRLDELRETGKKELEQFGKVKDGLTEKQYNDLTNGEDKEAGRNESAGKENVLSGGSERGTEIIERSSNERAKNSEEVSRNDGTGKGRNVRSGERLEDHSKKQPETVQEAQTMFAKGKLTLAELRTELERLRGNIKGNIESAQTQKTYEDIAGLKPNNTTGRIPVEPIIGGETKALKDIIFDVSKDLKQRLLFSKPGSRRGSLGTYSPGNSAVKIKFNGDLDTTAHEVGHSIDDHFGILTDLKTHPDIALENELSKFSPYGSKPPEGHPDPGSYKRAEGFAEWLRAYIVNPEAAIKAAPELHKLYQEKVSEAYKKALDSFSKDVRTFAGSSGRDMTLANIEFKPTEADGLFNKIFSKDKDNNEFSVTWADKVAANWVEPLKVFNKAFNYAKGLKGETDVLPENDPNILSRLLLGVDGKYGEILQHGMIDSKNELLKDADGNTKNLKWLLEPLDNTDMSTIEKDTKDVVAYMVAERTVELEKKLGRENTLSGIGGGLFKDIDVAKKTLDEFKNGDPEKLKRVEEAANRYREFADGILKYMVDKGRLSEEKYKEIKENNLQYVALKRVMETEPGREVESVMGGSKNLGSKSNVIETVKGSTKQIVNPYISLIDTLYKGIKESDRNEVLQSFRDMIVEDRSMYQGPNKRFSDIGVLGKEGDKNTTTIFIDGKPEHWIFQKDVHDAIKGLDHEAYKLPGIVTALPSVLRWTVTHFPTFAARNIARDLQDRLIKSEDNSGFKDLFGNKEHWRELARTGGLNSGYYMRDKASYYGLLEQAMDEMAKNKKIVLADPVKLKSLWKGYTNLLSKSETVNRVAEYRAAFRNAKTKGMDDYNASLYAGYKSRDLMDFALMGHYMKIVNQIIPFSNASVQGLNKTIKSAKANPSGFAARMFAYSVVPSVALWLLNHKDDETAKEYESLPAYQRDMSYNFKIGDNKWVSIPKPYELSLLGASVDRLLSQQYAGNSQAFNGYGGSVAKSLLPVDEGNFAGPMQGVVEGITNHDFFRDKYIVPPNEDALDLSLRNTEKASRLGKAIQDVAGIDARKADHFIKSQFSYFGGAATKVSDLGRNDGQKFGLSDLGFFKETPAYNSNQVQGLLEYAKQWDLGRSRPMKEFNRLAHEYFNAETDAEKDERAKVLTDFATHTLDTWKEQNINEKKQERHTKKMERKSH